MILARETCLCPVDPIRSAKWECLKELKPNQSGFQDGALASVMGIVRTTDLRRTGANERQI